MKKTLLASIALMLTFGGISQLKADPHYHYYDRDGYWDGDHHYHGREVYQHHNGYWDHRNGSRIFINID